MRWGGAGRRAAPRLGLVTSFAHCSRARRAARGSRQRFGRGTPPSTCRCTMPNSMQTSELVALVDMDGTLCDYDGALARDMERLRSPGEPHLLHREDEDANPWVRERRALIQRRPGWWRSLSRLALGCE